MPTIPKPEAIRIAEGGSRRSHRPMRHDLQGLGVPRPNVWFDDLERTIFLAVLDHAPEGLLTAADQSILEIYAIMLARLRRCDAALRREGLTLRGKDGEHRHPLVVVRRDCADEIHRCGQQLGLSPLSREKLARRVEEATDLAAVVAAEGWR